MKRFYAHPTEVDVYENDNNFTYAGANDNNVKVCFSYKIEDMLSPRQLEVFNLRNLRVEEIADRLKISTKSVEKYLKKIKLKQL